MLLAGLTEAVATLQAHFGRIDPPWSAVNRLVRGDVNIGLGGGPDVLHAIYGDFQDEDGTFHGIAGDSYVALVTWDADGTVSSQSIHQFGSATARPDSPHFADQTPSSPPARSNRSGSQKRMFVPMLSARIGQEKKWNSL